MKRRDFIKYSCLTLPFGLSACSFSKSNTSQSNSANHINPQFSQFRGFNLLEKISHTMPKEGFKESDFEMMAEWGLNFARLPLSYRIWTSPKDLFFIDEYAIGDIDEGVEFGAQYDVHINLAFHRTPGYCINGRQYEQVDLFDDTPERMQKALDATIFHWKYFARRYKAIPNNRLSFNLINEPPGGVEKRYEVIIRSLVTAIREEDPKRLIVIDGKNIARKPLLEVADLDVVHSTRGYSPMALTQYGKQSIKNKESETFKNPSWPLMSADGTFWDREELRKSDVEPWEPLLEKGRVVHVGEWGCNNQTSHDVMLAWAKDNLAVWKELGWGHALWNLRGPFGVLDSDRADVRYENYKGHRLDRQLLNLIMEFR